MRLQPNWSGEMLDLVVDFITYVFVPAYAITASGLLVPLPAPLLGIGIVVSGALYFADRRMKTVRQPFSRLSDAMERLRRSICSCCGRRRIGTAVMALLIADVRADPCHASGPRGAFALSDLVVIAGSALAAFAVVRDFEVPAR